MNARLDELLENDKAALFVTKHAICLCNIAEDKDFGDAPDAEARLGFIPAIRRVV